MLRKLSALLFLFVAACNQPTSEGGILQPDNSRRGADGYYFEHKEFESKDLRVKVELYQNIKQLQSKLKEIRPDFDVSHVVAFTVVKGDRSGCIIHIVDPAILYFPEFVGHEFLHCVNGNWHPTQGVN